MSAPKYFMQQKQPFINFEQQLFIELAQIYPTLTVRSMSKLLGKSDSYFSSISAQGVPISTSGLKSLFENIECKKIIHAHDEALISRINKVQELIIQEVIHRFKMETESMHDVWKEVKKTLDDEVKNEEHRYGAMPFVFMSRYR